LDLIPSFSFKDDKTDPKREKVQSVTAKATEIPHRRSRRVEVDAVCWRSSRRVLTTPCEEKRQRKPKYDPVKANSSLVSGFDSSTENQVDFKRLKDKKFCCTIPCEVQCRVALEGQFSVARQVWRAREAHYFGRLV
jgi:hypothetical protein